MTSIPGGHLSHMAACVKIKARDRDTQNLHKLILIAGGNDLTIRHHGTQLMANGLRSMEQAINSLKIVVKRYLPHVQFHVLDTIPRDSEDGKHVHVCYRLSCIMKCRGDEISDPNIAHVKLRKTFFKGNRMYGRPNACKDVQRYIIRPQLLANDGVHLSTQGLNVLKQVILWQCKEDTPPTLKLDIIVREGISVSVTLNMS